MSAGADTAAPQPAADPTLVVVVTLRPLVMPCRQCLAEPGLPCRWSLPKGAPEEHPEFHRIREMHAARATELIAKARSEETSK